MEVQNMFLTVPSRPKANSFDTASNDDSNESWMSDYDSDGHPVQKQQPFLDSYTSGLNEWILGLIDRKNGPEKGQFFGDYVLVKEDVTGGQELYAVPVVNNTSNPGAPLPFNFSTAMVVNGDYGDSFMKKMIGDAINANAEIAVDGSLRLPAVGLQARVYIKHTNTIKGWGLFAAEPIKAGRILTSYTGDLLSGEEASKRVGQHVFHFYINTRDYTKCTKESSDCQRLVVDANRYGNVARFVNHSCEANLQPENVLMRIGNMFVPQLILVAKRDIVAHEELTCTYVPTFRPSFRTLIKKCQCGTNKCIEKHCRC